MAGSSEQSAAQEPGHRATGEVRIRPVQELDIEEIATIDEGIGGRYRPEVWEKRVFYYLRRDPEELGSATPTTSNCKGSPLSSTNAVHHHPQDAT